jgi:hypothetical protein
MHIAPSRLTNAIPYRQALSNRIVSQLSVAKPENFPKPETCIKPEALRNLRFP